MTALPIAEEEARGLLAPLAQFSHVALAVSGGPDSVALMQLAARWRASRKEGPALSVLTVDHGLRPGSRAEAEHVGRMASALGLPHAILTWEHERLSEASLQERARVARYDLMAAYCHAHGIPALATAHTLDDQAETFLMRLKRGSGLDGLAAIPERGEWAGIAVLRPLLEVSKLRLIATLDAAGIAFVCDPSNIDPRFERARMRESTDALAALGLTAEAIALSARRLRRARAALEAATSEFLSRHSETNEAGYVLVDEAALAAAPDEIALRALARMIEAVGGSGERVQLAKVETLLAALKQEPGKAHTLGRCRIELVKGRLGIFREVRAGGLPVALVRPGERALWDNRFSIELGSGESEPILIKALGEQGLRTLRESEALPASLPRLAGRALPAVWRGDVLLGLPRLGQTGKPAKCDCSATFIGAGSA